MTQARRHSYQPGEWFGVIGERATVMLPPSEKARVAEIWALVDEGAGFDETLDALIANGLRDLPGFVLFSENDGATQVVVRGAARVELQSAEGPVEVAGSSVTTWVERVIEGVSSLSVVVEDAIDEASLAIHSGLVRLSRLTMTKGAAVQGDSVAPLAADAADGAADAANDAAADAPANVADDEQSQVSEAGTDAGAGSGAGSMVGAVAGVAAGAAAGVVGAASTGGLSVAAVDETDDASADDSDAADRPADDEAADDGDADSDSDADSEAHGDPDDHDSDDHDESDDDDDDDESDDDDDDESDDDDADDDDDDDDDDDYDADDDDDDSDDDDESDDDDDDDDESDDDESDDDDDDESDDDEDTEGESVDGDAAVAAPAEADEQPVPWWKRPEEALTRSAEDAEEPAVSDAAAESTPLAEAVADEVEAEPASADLESTEPASTEPARADETLADLPVIETVAEEEVLDSVAADQASVEEAVEEAQPEQVAPPAVSDSRDDFWSRISGQPAEPASSPDLGSPEPSSPDLNTPEPSSPEPSNPESSAPESGASDDALVEAAEAAEREAAEEKKPWWARAMGGLVGGGAAGAVNQGADEPVSAGRSALDEWAARSGLSNPDSAGEATEAFPIQSPIAQSPSSPGAAQPGSGSNTAEPSRSGEVPVFGAAGTPVAKLSFSSGGVHPVASSVVVGRAPDASKVTSTNPLLVPVPSPNNEISSTHLEIRPGTGLDLGLAVATDLNSTNGTVVIHPGLGPRALRPGVPEPLFPGSTVDLGDSLTIKVESPDR